MRKNILISSMAVAGTLSLLASCGGGDDGNFVITTPPTQTAIGTITSFGSVVVNGVRFDDSGATVTMNNATATRDRLRVGMVVQVRGQIRGDGTGVASSIRHDSCVQGPVTAMNRVQNTVQLLGQTVQVDSDTVFDGVSLQDMNAFAIGDHVDVSCLPDPAQNRLRATRMERLGAFQNGVSEMVASGKVSNLNLSAGTCTIGGLTVDFASLGAAGLPAGLANGMTIEARGKNFANGTLTADRLRDRDRDRISYPDGDGLEIEGLVSDYVSISSFKVDGQTVNAASAVIKNGTAADIRDGLKVEVEGIVTSGVLVATRVVIRLQADIGVEAGLQARDATLGTITLLGRSIKVNSDTEFRDGFAAPGRPTALTLEALAVADRLRISAYKDTAGDLIARRVERTAADPLVVVKAPADAKTPITRLTLTGFHIDTAAGTRYRDATGTLVDATTFYNAVLVPPAVPTAVHARGVVASLATNVVDATRAASTIGELEITSP